MLSCQTVLYLSCHPRNTDNTCTGKSPHYNTSAAGVTYMGGGRGCDKSRSAYNSQAHFIAAHFCTNKVSRAHNVSITNVINTYALI